MATGSFAVPSIRALCEADLFDIVCLVTNPLRYDKNGKPIITPARMVAAEFGLNISDKEDVHSEEFFHFLYLVRPDLIFVCDFGQILSKRALSGSLLGGINLHGSLLPKFRGAAPVHWAILTGETYTGVSIIHMTPQIDAGPVIAQSPPIPISPHETVLELEERLAEYGAELVLDIVTKMSRNETIRIIEQLHDRVSKAPRLKKENGLVPWDWSSHDIYNHFRAMFPWPKSFTDWHRADGSTLRLILGEICPLDNAFKELIEDDYNRAIFVAPVLTDAKLDNLEELKSEELKEEPIHAASFNPPANPNSPQHLQRHPQRPAWWKPGTVIRAGGDELLVAAADGVIRITQIQPAGKKMMPVHDFFRGYPLKEGDQLG